MLQIKDEVGDHELHEEVKFKEEPQTELEFEEPCEESEESEKEELERPEAVFLPVKAEPEEDEEEEETEETEEDFLMPDGEDTASHQEWATTSEGRVDPLRSSDAEPLECTCSRANEAEAQHYSHALGEAKPFPCASCENRSRETTKLPDAAKNLDGPARSIASKAPYKCSVCQKYFGRKSELDAHMRIHTGEKPFKCNICGKNFRVKRFVVVHMRKHTGEKKYQCHICKEIFAERGNLIVHIRIHTGEKPYKCLTCGKCFAQKTALIYHVRTHTGEKPYECTVCRKRYVKSGTLSNHMRVHTGERPFECSICGRSFRNKEYIIRHMKVHTGDRPYECTVCKKTFARKDRLNRHMKIHGDANRTSAPCVESILGNEDHVCVTDNMRIRTGVKPFECSVCKKRFTLNSNLIKHLRIHGIDAPKQQDQGENVVEQEPSDPSFILGLE